MSAISGSYSRVQPRPAGCSIPLTSMQRILWNRYLQFGPEASRICSGSLRVVGKLNEPLLRRCVDIVVKRHEALRTRIALDTPTQEVVAAQDSSFEVVDLRAQRVCRIPEVAMHLAQEFRETPVDWAVDPLFATKLLRLSDSEHVLLMGIDHIVADGAAVGIVRNEIAALYCQGIRGLHQSLPDHSLQFGDYAVWQQQTFESWRRLHEQYWRERFARTPWIEFPFDRVEQKQDFPYWTMTKFALGKDLSSSLRLIALRERVTVPLLLLGLITVAVSRWCGQSAWAMAVDVVSHGRHGHPEFAHTVGWISTWLQLQFKIEADDSLLELVKRIHLEYAAVMEHHDYGRLPDCMPMFTAPITFNWPATQWTRAPASAAVCGPDKIDFTPFSLYPPRGKLMGPYRCLEFRLLPDSDYETVGDVLGLFYQEDLLSARTVNRLSDTVRLVAEAFAADPLVKQSALSLAP